MVILIFWSGTGHLLSIYLLNLHKSEFKTWISGNIQYLNPVEINKAAPGLEIVEQKNGLVKEIRLNHQMYDVVQITQYQNFSNVYICIPDFKEQNLKQLFSECYSNQKNLPAADLLLKWKKTTFENLSDSFSFNIDISNFITIFIYNSFNIVYLFTDSPPPETVGLYS